MKATKRRVRNSEHKGEIREKYKGIDPSEIEVIPANEDGDLDIENRKMKVAAYVRVSTQNDEQTSSFELQVNDFTKRIKDNPNWEFAGIYSDESYLNKVPMHSQWQKCALMKMNRRCRMVQTVWSHNDLGISFAASSGRINIFKTTLKALGYPPYFRFLLDTDHKQLGIECCGYESDGSHTLPDDHTQEYYTVNSKDMVRFIYQTCGWDKKFTYRIKGIAAPNRRMVVFDLTTALNVAEILRGE